MQTGQCSISLRKCKSRLEIWLLPVGCHILSAVCVTSAVGLRFLQRYLSRLLFLEWRCFIWLFYLAVLFCCFIWLFYFAVLFCCFILLFYLAVLFCCFIWLFYLAVLFGCLILFFLKVDTVFQTTRRHTSEISYFPSQPSTYPYQPKGNVLEANCNVKNLLSCIQRRKKSLFANIRL